MMKKLLWVCVLTVMATVSAMAQENSLSTEKQQLLGVTTQTLASLKPVQELKPKANPEHPGLTMEKVQFANAGGNRWLWRLDFVEDFPVDNSNVIFYVNTDNDTATGRQNYKGIDLMVWVEKGITRTRFYDAAGANRPGPAAFAVVEGKYLYMSIDIDLHQKNGETVVPTQIVAHTHTPLKSQSATPFFELHGAPVSTTAKAERVKK
jgi:hypothetical protein